MSFSCLLVYEPQNKPVTMTDHLSSHHQHIASLTTTRWGEESMLCVSQSFDLISGNIIILRIFFCVKSIFQWWFQSGAWCGITIRKCAVMCWNRLLYWCPYFMILNWYIECDMLEVCKDRISVEKFLLEIILRSQWVCWSIIYSILLVVLVHWSCLSFKSSQSLHTWNFTNSFTVNFDSASSKTRTTYNMIAGWLMALSFNSLIKSLAQHSSTAIILPSSDTLS